VKKSKKIKKSENQKKIGKLTAEFFIFHLYLFFIYIFFSFIYIF
tara:strand:+ start:390 stop:521 length:132 start_codon:yes stop_codon:yes gene_type:complete